MSGAFVPTDVQLLYGIEIGPAAVIQRKWYLSYGVHLAYLVLRLKIVHYLWSNSPDRSVRSI